MAVVENRFVCDLSKPVQAQALKGNVFSLDNLGSRISVLIYDNGQPATISGSVTANCILPDGSTVNVNGGLTTENGGSKAYVDIPQSCLLISGILKIAIKCTSSSVITTLAAIVANVYMTKTDNVITPSQQIITDWNAEISAAIATQNAAIANQDTKINDLKSALCDGTILPEEYINGSINDSTGAIANARYRIVTNNLMHFDKTKVLKVVDSNYKVMVGSYDLNGNFIYEYDWLNNYDEHNKDRIVLSDTCKYRICIAKRTETTSETADIGTFSKSIRIIDYDENDAQIYNFISKYAYLVQRGLNGKQYYTGYHHCASSQPMIFEHDVTLTVIDPEYVFFVVYLNSDKSYKSETNYGTEFNIPKNTYFMVCIKKTPNDPDAYADVELYGRKVVIQNSIEYEKLKAKLVNDFSTYNQQLSAYYKTVNMKYNLPWVIGDLTSSEPYGQIGNSKKRVSNNQNLQFNHDIIVSVVDDNYKFNIYKYASIDATSAIGDSTPWIQTSLVIPSGTIFRIQIAKDTEDTNATVDSFISKISVTESALSDGLTVPPYWESTLATKIAQIRENETTMDKHNVSFLFITDYHANTNHMQSFSLINRIYNNCGLDFVIHGGDISDGGVLSRMQTFADKIRRYRYLSVRGNHDTDGNATESAYYNIMLKPIESYCDTNRNCYYYYDNESQKVRYIIMDSGGNSSGLPDTTELNWMKARLLELDSTWNVIIFQHHFIGLNQSLETIFTTQGTKVMNAISEIQSSMQCTIAAIISGHAHNDCSIKQDGIMIIGTTCDSGGANAADDRVNPNRPIGTTSEQTFDIIQIDLENRTIECTRIGVGNDRSFTY